MKKWFSQKKVGLSVSRIEPLLRNPYSSLSPPGSSAKSSKRTSFDLRPKPLREKEVAFPASSCGFLPLKDTAFQVKVDFRGFHFENHDVATLCVPLSKTVR
jgi:hypothetical protein